MLGWYFAKMHIPGQQVSRIILEGNSFAKPPSKEMLEKWKDDFYKALSAIDGMLIQSRYLCGNKLTLADIIIYNEI